MTEARPLDQAVAEALGCKVEAIQVEHPVYPGKIEGPVVGYRCGCSQWPGHRAVDYYEEDGRTPVYGSEFPPYSESWAVSGPLLEKYGISLGPERNMTTGTPVAGWLACRAPVHDENDRAHGATPLEAICKLVLALAAAGKLKEK